MRITKNQLRQIIKEELSGVLSEEEEEPFVPRADMDYESPIGYSPEQMKHFNRRLDRAKRAEAQAAPGYVKPEDTGEFADNPLVKYLKNREDDETQIAPKPLDTEIKESRRRKVRKTRRK